jgi:hypothetical protein
MANLVFELEKKLDDNNSPGIKRNVQRMKDVLDEAGILLMNPLGEPYEETRTDLEANIASDGSGRLFILDVIKPVLYSQAGTGRALLQKGVVIVGTKA